MASAAGQRQAGKETTKANRDVINSDPDFYDTGKKESGEDAKPSLDVPEQDLADDKALDNDKEAMFAEKDADKGDPDAAAIDAEPEGKISEKS